MLKTGFLFVNPKKVRIFTPSKQQLKIMEREIIIKLATELAKRDRENLCRLVSTMKF